MDHQMNSIEIALFEIINSYFWLMEHLMLQHYPKARKSHWNKGQSDISTSY